MIETSIESIKRLEHGFQESTILLFIEAIKAGKEPLNLQKMHRTFYKDARDTQKMSEKGAKAWASWQLEQIRREAVERMKADA